MDHDLGQPGTVGKCVGSYSRHASGQVERCQAAAAPERVAADRREVLWETELRYACAVLERVGADFRNYRAFDC